MAQLVARYLGVVEAAGSSPVTQTRKSRNAVGVSAFSVLYAGIESGFTQHLKRRVSGYLGVVGKKKKKQPGGCFFEVFPPKAGSSGGEAVPSRWDDHATAEGSADSIPVTQTKNPSKSIDFGGFFLCFLCVLSYFCGLTAPNMN